MVMSLFATAVTCSLASDDLCRSPVLDGAEEMVSVTQGMPVVLTVNRRWLLVVLNSLTLRRGWLHLH